ncbi:hypothetical protein [Ancylobacter terrae]|uniref:hypothetical protein n=1 Tax=Ancylobacter sp. sgz301288 TaxID=3342077 RepID=UPI00385B5EC3
MSDSERLRDRIDAGKAGDKVPFPDPAAAPLGTDDEAAGRPPAASAPTADGETTVGSGTDERGRPYADEGVALRGISFATAVSGLLLVIVGFALAVALLS